MNNFVNLKKDLCYGCRACSNICPTDAITFKNDEYGFSYPQVDLNLCINCGKCSFVCNKLNEISCRLPKKAFATSNRNKEVLKRSASGGVFSALADHVLENGGAICGCIYDYKLKPIHICAENNEKVIMMRKSKYAQSDIGFVYREIKNKLKNGQIVLFTGTPCQVSALYSTLGCDYDNLITMDLVCHGVPSEMMFQSFLKYLENKYNTKIKSFDFRSKKYGWQRYTMEFTDDNGRTKNIGKFNEFYHNAFISGNIMRPNCFTCKFASPERVADITVGDLWGYESLNLKKCDSKNGISLLTLNTQKAIDLFPTLEKSLVTEEINYKIAVARNTCLHSPTKRGEKWDYYMQSFKDGNIDCVAKQYILKNRKEILKAKIKLLIPIKLFQIIKKKRQKNSSR